MSKKLRQLQQQILQQRGLTRKKRSKPQPAPLLNPVIKPKYSKQMYITELLLGVDLRSLLFSKTDAQLAKMLGVTKSTICRWRKRILEGRDR